MKKCQYFFHFSRDGHRLGRLCHAIVIFLSQLARIFLSENKGTADERKIQTEMGSISAGWLIKSVIGAVLGAAAGTALPAFVKKLIEYKYRKKGKPVPDGIMSGANAKIIAIAADAVLTALTAALLGLPAAAAAFLIIQIALVCVFVDWYIRIIANEAVLLMLVLGVIYRILAGGASSLLGSLAALGLVTLLFGGSAALMTAIKGRPEVGAGDLKYAMAAAVTVGWPGVIYMLLCFAAAVLVYIFVGMKRSMLTMNTYFPMCLQLSVGLLGGIFLPLLWIV